MSDAPVPPAPRRPGSVALAALWTVGIVAVVVAAASLVTAVTWTGTGGAGDELGRIVLTQLVFGFGPGLLSGGVVCIGLALVVTALRAVIGARVDRFEGGSGREPDAVVAPDFPAHDRRTDSPSAPSRPIDPEAFKRPRSASDPRP